MRTGPATGLWGGLSTVSHVDVEATKPAACSPRKIAKEQQQEPCKSVRRLGPIAPIPANRKGNVVIAGRRRTKAARLAGIRTVPAQHAESISLGDETKLDQARSATEPGTAKARLDGDAEKGKLIEPGNEGFATIKSAATVAKEVCGLTPKHGNALSAVICKGDATLGGDCAKARKALGPKASACACDGSMHDGLPHRFGEDCGEHSHDRIKRDARVQGPAQPCRSASRDDGRRAQRSTLHARHAVPHPKERSSASTVLDFGCGKGGCTRHPRKTGHEALGAELFNDNGKATDAPKGNRMIGAPAKHLQERGQSDAAACGSAPNSVDSMKAERSAIDLPNLMASDRLLIGGRPLDSATRTMKRKKDAASAWRAAESLDADNFSANYRSGKRRFQHCRSKEQIKKSLEESGFEIVELDLEKRGSSWQCEAVKAGELPLQRCIDAIDFEFDLPLPNGRGCKRNGDAKKALDLERYRGIFVQARPYARKESDSMAIKSIEAEGTFRRLWPKSARDVDSPRRRARCLIGDYDGRINNRPTKARDIELFEDVYHLCGASSPHKRENNLHLAFRRKDGSTIEHSSNGATARIEGAERLPIDAKHNNPADRHCRTKPYCTCRNWQFANYYETHMKRGAENG